MDDNGILYPIREAFSGFMARWYRGLAADTPALREYVARGVARSIAWAPDRMIDAAEKMLASYQKNANGSIAGKGALLPMVIMAMGKDYAPVLGDFGGRQIPRQLVTLKVGGPVYGYRQAMGEVRVQIVIIAPDSTTAKSMAAQYALYLGEPTSRTCYAQYSFGETNFEMPVLIESPDVPYQSIDTGQNNLTVLAADLTIKVTLPFLDAPATGAPNDGSTHVPPGYPLVNQITARTPGVADRVISVDDLLAGA